MATRSLTLRTPGRKHPMRARVLAPAPVRSASRRTIQLPTWISRRSELRRCRNNATGLALTNVQKGRKLEIAWEHSMKRLVCCFSVLVLGAGVALAQSVISAQSGLIHYSEGRVMLGERALETKFGEFPQVKKDQELRT